MRGFFPTDTDECLSNPCENGGTCVNKINEFECVCPPPITGTTCTEGYGLADVSCLIDGAVDYLTAFVLLKMCPSKQSDISSSLQIFLSANMTHSSY